LSYCPWGVLRQVRLPEPSPGPYSRFTGTSGLTGPARPPIGAPRPTRCPDPGCDRRSTTRADRKSGATTGRPDQRRWRDDRATAELDPSWRDRGGFATLALVSATVIAAAVQQGGAFFDADLAAGTPTIATDGDSTALRLGLGGWVQSTRLAEGAIV